MSITAADQASAIVDKDVSAGVATIKLPSTLEEIAGDRDVRLQVGKTSLKTVLTLNC